MGDGEWIETKKEYERGELVKVTTELKKEEKKPLVTKYKDHLDVVFRTIGIASILVPFIIFLNQRSAESRRQKAQFQIDIYSVLSTKIHRWENRYKRHAEFDTISNMRVYMNDYDDLGYDSAMKEIVNESYPKLLLLNDSVVLEKFNSVVFCEKMYRILNFTMEDYEFIKALSKCRIGSESSHRCDIEYLNSVKGFSKIYIALSELDTSFMNDHNFPKTFLRGFREQFNKTDSAFDVDKIINYQNHYEYAQISLLTISNSLKELLKLIKFEVVHLPQGRLKASMQSLDSAMRMSSAILYNE